MSSPSSIAVLLATYNGMKWIEEQVESILNQQSVDVNIYISVDLSTDNTYQWCQDLAKQNVHVKVLPYGERFGGAAKNFFRLIRDVDFSTYDYVSLADQDDIWLPNKLSHAVETIKRKDVCALSSSVTAFFLSGRELLIEKSQPQKKFDHLFEAAGPGCTYVFKSDALQQFKDFLILNWNAVNDIELHDWMMYAYFREHDLDWHIDSKPLMRYRIHESNQVGANSGFKAYQKRLSIIKNGWYRRQVEDIRTLVNPNLALNRLFLIKNFWQLRRKPKEVIILLFLLVLGLY
ncbi:Alpha-L-Rha alpha-1,3-L-rhamnosyltransferase (EC [uncultured Gammaproteobacteria bacterium]|jgi:rhamnosyltransferase|nr:Alpha-L-Rha alpha-1,3-L-rhamnosyltransferase (EC [uncultured Gammaproteobacteria bacterium]